MERWTNREETELTRLLKRKAELIDKNMQPLIALVRLRDLQHLGNEEIAECLAEYADDFCDKLEPFDSGIRCAIPEPSNAALRGDSGFIAGVPLESTVRGENPGKDR